MPKGAMQFLASGQGRGRGRAELMPIVNVTYNVHWYVSLSNS